MAVVCSSVCWGRVRVVVPGRRGRGGQQQAAAGGWRLTKWGLAPRLRASKAMARMKPGRCGVPGSPCGGHWLLLRVSPRVVIDATCDMCQDLCSGQLQKPAPPCVRVRYVPRGPCAFCNSRTATCCPDPLPLHLHHSMWQQGRAVYSPTIKPLTNTKGSSNCSFSQSQASPPTMHLSPTCLHSSSVLSYLGVAWRVRVPAPHWL